MEAFMGCILAWAPTFAPRGWALCNGQLLSISQNSALFSLIGTTYGGDGQSSFALPNLIGRVPLGSGQTGASSNFTIGQMSGTENITLQTLQIPAHNHAAQASVPIQVSSSPSESTTPSPGASIAAPGTIVGRDFTPTYGFNSVAPDTTLNPATAGMASVNIGNTGGNQPHDNMQPYLAINYIICVSGIFPSRN